MNLDIDECQVAGQPCLNGGNCTHEVGRNMYNCSCAPGYFGKHCQNGKEGGRVGGREIVKEGS